MSKFIFRNFANAVAVCVILGTLFVFIFQLLAVNATRDRTSERIREIEAACKREEAEIRSLQSDKERLTNAEVLRGALRRDQTDADGGEFMDTPEKIIRVRTHSVPYGAGRAPAPQPQALAVELSELAALSAKRGAFPRE